MRFQIKRLLVQCACLVAVAVAATSSMAGAASYEPVPMSVNAFLPGNTFVMGEPIIVHYSIQNLGNVPVHPELGDGKNQFLEGGHTKWFSVSLRDSSGKSAPLLSFRQAPYKGVVVSGPTILPGDLYDGSIVASDWIYVPQPGAYTLSVVFKSFLPSEDGDYPSQSYAGRIFTFPLTITAADQGHMRLKARSFRVGLLGTRDVNQQRLLIHSLFCLPEAVALTEWQTLFSDVSTPMIGETRDSQRQRLLLRREVLEEVTHVDSTAAVDLMAQVYWREDATGADAKPMESDKTDAATALISLSDMYAHSNASLKKHIKDVFAAHGQEPPTVPLVRLD